jgi:hypothetical protein
LAEGTIQVNCLDATLDLTDARTFCVDEFAGHGLISPGSS